MNNNAYFALCRLTASVAGCIPQPHRMTDLFYLYTDISACGSLPNSIWNFHWTKTIDFKSWYKSTHLAFWMQEKIFHSCYAGTTGGKDYGTLSAHEQHYVMITCSRSIPLLKEICIWLQQHAVFPNSMFNLILSLCNQYLFIILPQHTQLSYPIWLHVAACGRSLSEQIHTHISIW